MTSVLIADDQALVRDGFRLILSIEPGIEVVGEATTGREAVAGALELRPDVVLMDIRMPDLDGIAATRQIVGSTSSTRVLILTTFDDDGYLYDALRAGAAGFLVKDVRRDQLVHAIHVIAAGEALLAPKLLRRMIEAYCQRPSPQGSRDALANLTEREVQVLTLVGRGLSNNEIATSMHLGEATVKTHLGHVFQKLALRDRVQAVVHAYESGLVIPGASA